MSAPYSYIDRHTEIPSIGAFFQSSATSIAREGVSQEIVSRLNSRIPVTVFGTTDELDEPIRVLYMSSDPAFARLAQTKLQQTNLKIDCVFAGGTGEALHRLASDQVDCVMMAYSLEDSDGIGFMESIRRKNDKIPILLFTRRDSEYVASEAARTGVSDYIPARSKRNNFTLLATRIQTFTAVAHKRTEAEQTRRRFRRTLERAAGTIYAVDSDWCIEYMNEKMAERVDRDPGSIIGETIWGEFSSVVRMELRGTYRTAMETGESVSLEQYLEEPLDYWVEVRAFPDDGGLAVFSREITTERERELKLERGNTVLENIHDIAFILSKQGDIDFVNTVTRRLLVGDPSAQLTGQRLETAIGDHINDSDMTRFSQTVESTPGEIKSDGGSMGLCGADFQLDVVIGTNKRAFDVRITPFQSRASKQVVVVARDVTEENEMERQLERERDALQDL